MTFYVETDFPSGKISGDARELSEKLGFDVEDLLRQVAGQVLESEKCPYEAQVNLLITDDQGIREYNNRFRQMDSPTDVLSFPMIDFVEAADFSAVEDAEADHFDPESGELLMGDIVISAEKVKEQADKYGHSIKREFAFLLAHSMFHLCGYDHLGDEEAHIMEQKQEEALLALGITKH